MFRLQMSYFIFDTMRLNACLALNLTHLSNFQVFTLFFSTKLVYIHSFFVFIFEQGHFHF
jgi:hypothetical protein